MIRKLLIANRGEIAVRIIRTCREMGIRTVAVYSTADANALHVQMADESVCIGGPAAKDSYLNMNNIIQAACQTGCDAIHPGFGFLSENALFARLVEAVGLVFIGPKADVIERMGNKNEARKTMQEAGIPVIEGTPGIVSNWKRGLKAADQIGFPVMIKAANGGGGKGMRIVHDHDAFKNAFLEAKAEAKACFGNDDMYIEKYIENPKHVEIQVAADEFGNVVHLFERDCSFQIRNQKMLEEAPCFLLDDKIRKAMCKDAVKACQAVHYSSLGTIEFLLDASGTYYFMEMNTRIQVEHPVTEMITGLDLVKLQIRIANHNPLGLKQKDIVCRGHAMECRINAEDAKADLKPDAGKITFLNLPGGRGVRVDGGIYDGYTVPPFYDSMLVKVITFGDTRLECIKKMRQAMEECVIDGIHTNEEFHYFVLHQKELIEGVYDTSFAQKCLKEWMENESV
ncbi:acetyl-CoA carboxylase biotin carboxylase subunit [Catenisphaera adipataccumulans]|jgi:acetyl-CoA carboxylase biotin carboxylase subunit|uniref:Biotin carboxylase n=1 Tax=Catenisphaera adipataccumulans TaxID=700500 RepID=A0A7W8FU95_9FIRM|nr:acetyl-CoA carboxylase biotin carboxylase subunit [Catenisphaera adipataccumulans]MBB5182364.1 acetyl-CoA carboxylase biotin carboxylase subunit [Catenisphaera adipataccumulans]